MTTLPLRLLCFALGAAFCLVAAALAGEASPLTVEQHFSPFENLEAIDASALAGARKRIDIAAYVLTDVKIIEALAEAAETKGVAVRVYLSAPDARPDPSFVADAMARLGSQKGVEIRRKHSDVFMHLKSYCVDGALLRSGSANFSASGEKRQDNDLLFIRGATACAAFEADFERMWGR